LFSFFVLFNVDEAKLHQNVPVVSKESSENLNYPMNEGKPPVKEMASGEIGSHCGTYWIRTSDLMRVKHAL